MLYLHTVSNGSTDISEERMDYQKVGFFFITRSDSIIKQAKFGSNVCSPPPPPPKKTQSVGYVTYIAPLLSKLQTAIQS